MRVPLCASLAVLCLSTAGAAVTQPSVWLLVTHDASVSQHLAEEVEYAIRERVPGRGDWRPAAEIGARETLHLSSRRDLIAAGRRTGASYAAEIRLARAQATLGMPWIDAQAWVVAADSGTWAVVTGGAWSAGDSSAMARHIDLLLARLVPPTYRAACYAELADPRVVRDSLGVIREATVDVHLYAKPDQPVHSAAVTGYWRVNGRPGAAERLPAPDGVAHARLDVSTWLAADTSGHPVADAGFVVTSAECPGATYDSQWPQREVDRMVALLENARADLDEDLAYDLAIARAQQFLTIREGDLARYEVLMSPPGAPNRRQQAVSLLRRAQRERVRLGPLPARTRSDGGQWIIAAAFGYDVLPPREGSTSAAPVRCDTCGALRLATANSRRLELGLLVRRHIAGAVWLGTGLAWSYGRITVSGHGKDARNVSLIAVTSSLWVPRKLAGDLVVYGELGGQLARRSETTGNRYWTDTRPVETPPASGPYWREPREDMSLQPGVVLAFGAVARLSDWTPAWGYADLSLAIDRLRAADVGGSRFGWRIAARAGVSLWR